MEQIFIQLALILFTAFIVSYIAKMFNQPLIIGYIISGILVGYLITGALSGTQLISIESNNIIGIFSQLGIAFLLFIVGLHLNPKVIREIGFSSLLVGLGQMILTFALTFIISLKILGFDSITSIYVGIALSFSSTIIIMKLLSDKKQLDSLYGKLSIGILIIQDLVAIMILVVISSVSKSAGTDLGSFATRTLLSGGGLVVLFLLIGFFGFPRLIRSVAKSQELLFLFSICWCFVAAALFSFFGFSIEIGALMAGVVLSISPYSTEISAKIRPLRDFFLIIFFIILGLNIQISNINAIFIDAFILSLIALLLKPIILIVLMGFFGYTKRTNFLTGTSLGQISEFSIIVIALAITKGHVGKEILSTLTLTLVITFIISTYMIMYSRGIYGKASEIFTFLKSKKSKKRKRSIEKYDAILFGYNRIGFGILNSLKKIKKKYLVVDFNPDTIANLTKWRIPSLYGDIDDPDFLDELPLEKISMAVSTIPDFETNLLLIESIREINEKAIIIARAHQIKDALELYKKGANYVLTPHFLGGEHVSRLIKGIKTKRKGYRDEAEKHIKSLKKIMEMGHEHPEVEKN